MRTKVFAHLKYVLFLFAATSIQASDGVLEINQACAINGGCFEGDTAGFPVTITQPGSYLLTGNLTLSAANDRGILVQANDASIDLNGFTIQGITVCTGIPVTSCTPFDDSGFGVGTLSGTDIINVTVRNGTIRGMGGYGIFLGVGSRVIDIRSTNNGRSGVSVYGNSIVSDCILYRNGNDGIEVNRSVSDPEDLLVIIQGNNSSGNGENGIQVSNASSLLIGNTVSRNRVWGIRTPGADSGYINNVVLSNDGGTISGAVELGSNLCNGSTTCP